MQSETRKFAIVTGASTGIGFALAEICLEHSHIEWKRSSFYSRAISSA